MTSARWNPQAELEAMYRNTGAGAPFSASSVKADLDTDWSDPEQKQEALNRLVEQVDSLERWVERVLHNRCIGDPVQRYLDALSEF